ncbi:MAG: Hpt domain-containing protein [Verrucomicrobiota bacterium]
MSARDEELLRRLLTTFQVEAREHIDAMAAGLVGLERAAAGDAAARVLDSTFRHAHSLKGAARAVNAGDIESVCQALESVFAAMKRERLAPSPELFDLLHRVVDLLTRQLEHLGRGAAAKGRPRTGEILAALQAVLGGATAPAAAPATAPPAREKWPPSPRRPGPRWVSPPRVRRRSACPPRSWTPCCSRPRKCSWPSRRARSRPPGCARCTACPRSGASGGRG